MPDRLAQLEQDGLVQREGSTVRATRRWQAAVARAAFGLVQAGELGDGDDFRAPIALALLELYGPDTPDEELADLVEVILPVTTAELG
jgi:hypothetical protein